ncbi:DUF3995 domain-containing protein [Streptomyces sp. NPDC005955]|uniref:DUF3995 domain-containing protein n=1 Tax=Streptomyces sp. NPDC005955 TaxID=3364738 RepID=UPI00369BC6B8
MSLRLGDAASRPGRWPGHAAVVWGLAFAVPSFAWAWGIGLTTASTALAPPLVELARERDPGFIALLWATGVLKAVGGLLGVALVCRRAWGRGTNRLLQLAGWGATVLLVWHGAEFVVHGLLVEAHVIDIDPDLSSVTRWYTYLWGPWFVAGGVLFGLAARTHLSTVADRGDAVIAGRIGGFGALALSAAAALASRLG